MIVCDCDTMKFLSGILILQTFTAWNVTRARSTRQQWDINEIYKGNPNPRLQFREPVLGQANPTDSNTDIVSFAYFPAKKFGIPLLTIETDHIHGLNRAELSEDIQYKFINPGFFQTCESHFPRQIVEAYLKRMEDDPKEKYQIFCVDWRTYSGVSRTDDVLQYLKSCIWLESDATIKAPDVAKLTVKFIKFLKDQHKIKSYKDIHIIGLDVGCHIAGHIGDLLQGLSDGKHSLGRITALDPPDEKTLGKSDLKKLERNDAEFVDVYHTDAKEDGSGYGTSERLGHVDYFPNGGGTIDEYSFKNCTNSDFEFEYESIPRSLKKLTELLMKIRNNKIIKSLLDCRGQYTPSQLCNHKLAYIFFAESILNDKIVAYKCKSFDDLKHGYCDLDRVPHAIFGEYVDKTNVEPGTYYLEMKLENNYKGLRIREFEL